MLDQLPCQINKINDDHLILVFFLDAIDWLLAKTKIRSKLLLSSLLFVLLFLAVKQVTESKVCVVDVSSMVRTRAMMGGCTKNDKHPPMVEPFSNLIRAKKLNILVGYKCISRRLSKFYLNSS